MAPTLAPHKQKHGQHWAWSLSPGALPLTAEKSSSHPSKHLEAQSGSCIHSQGTLGLGLPHKNGAPTSPPLPAQSKNILVHGHHPTLLEQTVHQACSTLTPCLPAGYLNTGVRMGPHGQRHGADGPEMRSGTCSACAPEACSSSCAGAQHRPRTAAAGASLTPDSSRLCEAHAGVRHRTNSHSRPDAVASALLEQVHRKVRN